MIDATKPRWAQATADAAGAGSAGEAAGQAKTADSGTNATPPAGAAGAADSAKDGAAPAKSMLDADGADQGDASKVGKDAAKGKDQDAAAAEKPAPVKIQLPEKLPDGVSVDKDFVAGVEKKFAELGIDSEEGNALVGWYIEQEGQRVAKSIQVLQQFSQEQYETLAKDPEFGGKNLAESQACVQKAINRFGKSTGLVERLKSLGLENDPAIIKTLAAIGRAISEDRSSVDLAGDKPVLSEQEERLRKRYPTMSKER